MNAKRIIGLVVVLLLSGCRSVYVAERRTLTLPPIAFPIETLSFRSGLRVIVERDARTPLTGVFLVVGSGSTSDPAGKEGLAHFIEHLTFRSRPTGAGTFQELLDQRGVVSSNAFTNFDSTTFYELGLTSNLPEMLRIEGARMVAPVVNVTPAEEETERAVVVNELRTTNETGFTGDVLDKLQAELFPAGHPYARSVIGTHQTLAALGPGDVQAFLAAHYQPDNMTLLILGDVDLDAAQKLVEESLPPQLTAAAAQVQLKPRMGRNPPAVPDAPPAPAMLLPTVEEEVTSPELWLGWTLPRSFGSDAYLLSFLAKAAQKQLVKAMLDDKNITGITAEIVPGAQASILVCRASLKSQEQADASRAHILKQVSGVWGTQGSWYGPAAEREFRFEREVAVLHEVRGAQDLIARGLERVTSAHFAESATRDSWVVPELLLMRQQQLWDFANPYFTAERARAILVLPIAGRSSSPPLLESDSGDAKTDSPAPPLGSARGWERERLHALLPELQRTVYRLPSGLTVVLEPRPGLPLVSAGVLFPSLAKDPNEEAEEFALTLVGDPGGMMNSSPRTFGSTFSQQHGPDHLSYFLDGSRGNLDQVVAGLAEYVRFLSVHRAPWLMLQEYAGPQLERAAQDPGMQATSRLQRSLYPTGPYGNMAGAAELKAISRGDVNAWAEKVLVPANAALVLVGDFDPVEAKALIERTFGHWTAQAIPLAAPEPPSAPPGDAFDVQVTARPGATQSQLELACLLEPTKSAADLSLHEVSARLLADRLWKVLRERMGATYSIQATSVTLRGGVSALFASSAVENGKLVPVLSTLKQTLAALAETEVSAEELAKAKVERGDAHAIARMTNHGMVKEALSPARLGFPLDGPGPAERLDAVTVAEVRQDFQRCAHGTPRLLLLGDETILRAAVQEVWH